jgi:hypothetical protein
MHLEGQEVRGVVLRLLALNHTPMPPALQPLPHLSASILLSFSVLQEWTLLGQVAPTPVSLSPDQVELGWEARGAFGANAAQLAVLLGTGEGANWCSKCGGPYLLDHSHRQDERRVRPRAVRADRGRSQGEDRTLRLLAKSQLARPSFG